MIHFLIGYLLWGVAQYFVHEFWHAGMRKGKKTKAFHNERMHHVFYDQRPPALGDEKLEHITFPIIMVVLMCVPFVGIYTIFAGLIPAISAGCIPIICAKIDGWIHYQCHMMEPRNKVLRYLQRRHDIHHKNYACNLSFFTAIWMDVLLRTNRNK